MIVSPGVDAHAENRARIKELEDIENLDPNKTSAAARKRVGYIKVRKAVHYPDPDKAFDSIVKAVNTRIVDVDAKMMESGKVKHYRSLREMMASPTVRQRILKVYKTSQLKEVGERLQESLNTAFQFGIYDDEVTLGDGVFRVQDAMLPSLNSPYAKQQLFVDYMDMHRKCWDAATRNPIAKRICKIIPQFVLGRGVDGNIAEPKHQEAWDEFFEFNEWQLELKLYLRELITYGEIFLRYFRTEKGLAVRSIDPSTIWDIITDPDDLKNVQYYHQQYVLSHNSPVAGVAVTPATLIIRQIPAADVDHFRINGTSSEKRGRSELYAILGWLLRFKEFANDRVLLNKMRAMFALDVKVVGDNAEVNAAESQFATPPGPGAVLVHNDNVEVEFKNANTNANEAKTDADMLLRIIAIGAGISEQFLGAGAATTRASALIQTEPDVKNFEDYQEIVEVLMRKAYKRVVAARGLAKTDHKFEATFPAIAQEDRSTKLKDLAHSEAMDWFTKERSATMAAREFGITNYDFLRETEAIRLERAMDPVVMQGFQSAPKVAADPNAALGEPTLAGGPEGDDDQAVVQTSAQMGFSAKGASGRNLADTKPTLDRTNFTRGGERASIKGRKSAGAPTYESVEPTRHNVWGEKARQASLIARRRKAEIRRQQLAQGQGDPDGS